MAKKLQDDEIRWILSINGSEAIGAMNRIKKESDELIKANAEIRKEMEKLEKQGKTSSKLYKEMAFDYQQNIKLIRENTQEFDKLKKELKLTDMTTSQLRDRQKELQDALDNTSMSADPKAYKELQKQLKEVEIQMTVNERKSKSLMTVIAGMPGPLGASAKGVTSLKVAFQALGKAGPLIILTAIIGAFTLIVKSVKSFTNASEEGAAKFAVAMAPVKVVVQVLGDLFRKLGKMVVDTFAWLSDGVYKIAKFFAPESDFVKRIERQVEVEKKVLELSEKEREILLDNKKRENEMSELRMKIAQRDKYSLDQRKKFVDEYLVAENKLYENKKLLAQEQYDLEKKRLKNQAFLNEEEKNKLSELERNVQDAETERIQNLERLDERRRTLLSQDIAEQTQAVERQKEAIKKQLENIDEKTEYEKLALQERYNRGEIMESVFQKRLQDIEFESYLKKLEIYNLDAETRKKLELEVYQFRVKMAGETLKHISQFNPEELAQERAQRSNDILKGVNETMRDISKESLQNMKDDLKSKEELQKRYTDLAMSAADSFGDMLGSFMTSSKEEAAQYQYEMLLLSLDTLRQIVLMSTVEILAKEIGEKSFVGIATAAALTAIVNAAFSAVKSAIKKPDSSNVDTTTSGNTPNRGARVVAGFADGGYTGPGGKYEIAGYLPDGRPYHRGEYFVPQEEMNIPMVAEYVRRIERVRRLRTDSNPLPDGFADGGYTGVGSGSPDTLSPGLIRELIYSLKNLRATVVLRDIDRAREREKLLTRPFTRKKNKV